MYTIASSSFSLSFTRPIPLFLMLSLKLKSNCPRFLYDNNRMISYQSTGEQKQGKKIWEREGSCRARSGEKKWGVLCCSLCDIGSVVKCECITQSFIMGAQWLSVWQEEGWGSECVGESVDVCDLHLQQDARLNLCAYVSRKMPVHMCVYVWVCVNMQTNVCLPQICSVSTHTHSDLFTSEARL